MSVYGPIWKGHYITYYLPYRDKNVYGWHPEDGFHWQGEKHAEEMFGEVVACLKALQNND